MIAQRLRVSLTMVVLGIGTIVACGVPGDSSFKRTPSDKIPFNLADTTTTSSSSSTTTTVSDSPVPTTVAPLPQIQEFSLYFVAGSQVVEVPTPVFAPASLGQVLILLENGPPAGDVSTGVRSAIPARAKSIPNQSRGLVTIDLPTDFFTGMEPQDQRLAVAQYVLTVTELAGVGQVKFTQEGLPISVNNGNGQATEPGQSLVHDDYERLLKPGAPEVTIPATTVVAVPPDDATSTTVAA